MILKENSMSVSNEKLGADIKSKKEDVKKLVSAKESQSFFEALQSILFLPKDSREYSNAVRVLLTFSKSDILNDVCSNLLKILFENKIPALPFKKEQIENFPNLMDCEINSVKYYALNKIISLIFQSKEEISSLILNNFKKTIEKNNIHSTKILTMISMLLHQFYGNSGSKLIKTENKVDSIQNNYLDYDNKNKKLNEPTLNKEKINQNIEKFLSADVLEKEKTFDVPENLIVPLRRLRDFLFHPLDKSLRLQARDVFENFNLSLSLPKLLSLLVDNKIDVKDLDSDFILVIGPTGVGKTTLANYLTGVKYSRVKNFLGEQLIPKPGQNAIGTMSPGFISQTLFPKKISNEQFTFIDCAGSDENRGEVKSICSALGLPMIVDGFKTNKKIRAVIVVMPYEISNPHSSTRGKSLDNFAKIIGDLFVDVTELSKDRNILFVTSAPPKPEYDLNERFEVETIKDNFISRIKELYESRSKDFQYNIPHNIDKLKDIDQEKSELSECIVILENYKKILALKNENSLSQFFNIFTGNKKEQMEEIINKELSTCSKLSGSNKTILKSKLLSIFNEDENKQHQMIEKHIEEFDRKILTLHKEHSKLMVEHKNLQAEKDILEIIINNKDVFIFRGYEGKENDDPDHYEEILDNLMTLRKKNIVIDARQFNFNPTNEAFKKAYNWASEFSKEARPILSGLLNIPGEIAYIEHSMRSLEEEIKENKVDLNNTFLSLKKNSNPMVSNGVSQNIQITTGQPKSSFKSTKDKVDELNGEIDNFKKRRKEIEDMKAIEFGTRRAFESRSEFIVWRKCMQTNCDYEFPGKLTFNNRYKNETNSIENFKDIPIEGVELTCSVNNESKLLIKQDVNKINLDVTIKKPLEDDILHITKLKSDASVSVKSAKISEVISNGFDQKGYFAVTYCDLEKGVLKINYKSEKGKPGDAIIRTFVLPKNLPEYKSEIKKIDDNINSKQDILSGLMPSYKILKDGVEKSLQYINSAKNKNPQERTVLHIEHLKKRLRYDGNDFVKEFFPEISSELKIIEWLKSSDKIELLSNMGGSSAEEFKEIFNLKNILEFNDINDSIFYSILFGNESKQEIKKEKSDTYERDRSILENEMPKDFFVKMSKIYYRTGLSINSINQLIKEDLSSNIQKVSSEGRPADELNRLAFIRAEKLYILNSLSNEYKKLSLMFSTYDCVVSTLDFSKRADGPTIHEVRDSSLILREKALNNQKLSQFSFEERKLIRSRIINKIDEYISLYHLKKEILLREVNDDLNQLVLSKEKNVEQTLPLKTLQKNNSSILHENLETKKFNLTKNIKSTLGDGNCAFNAFALGLCDLIEQDKVLLSTVYETLAQALKLHTQTKQGILTWLSTIQNHTERQKMLGPILRKLAMEFIESKYSYYKSTFEAGLTAAFYEYKNGRYDETYSKHNFIKIRFDSLKQPSIQNPEKELIEWWCTTGKEEYFEVMKRPAISGNDNDRWGSEAEISALASQFKITVKCKKNGNAQILGFGYGELELSKLTREETEQLKALELGCEQLGVFKLEIDSKIKLEQKLNQPRLLSTEIQHVKQFSAEILSYINENNDKIKIPGLNNIKAFCEKLKNLNILIPLSNKNTHKFRFANKDTLEQLYKPMPDDLKKKILDVFNPNVPQFELNYDEEHWSYIDILDRNKNKPNKDEGSKKENTIKKSYENSINNTTRKSFEDSKTMFTIAKYSFLLQVMKENKLISDNDKITETQLLEKLCEIFENANECDKYHAFIKNVLNCIKFSEEFKSLSFGKNKNWLSFLTMINKGSLLEKVKAIIPILIKSGVSPYSRDINGQTLFVKYQNSDPENILTLFQTESYPGFFGVEDQIKKITNYLKEIISNPKTKDHFLLLSGPSGVGKTELVKFISKSQGFLVKELERGTDNDKWVGQLETRIIEFFRGAVKTGKPTCLFFDEMDSICSKPQSNISSGYDPDRITTLIQTEIDKLEGTKVVVMGTTNYLTKMKNAIKSRAGIPIVFNYPDLNIRNLIINYNLRFDRLEDVSIVERLTAATSGWSPRQLQKYITIVKNKVSNEKRNSITNEDFIQSFEPMRDILRKERLDELGIDIILPSLKMVVKPKFGEGTIPMNETVKQQLALVCMILENSKGLSSKRKNILLEGPPGTGKTEFAKLIANYSNTVFINIDPTVVRSDSTALGKSFEEANRYEKAVIFMDEIDAIAFDCSPYQFILQVEMDGFKNRNNTNTLVIIAATNKPNRIADPILSRLGDPILIALPSEMQRCAMFRYYLKNKHDLKFEFELCTIDEVCLKLSAITTLFAPRDIKKVIDSTCDNAVLRSRRNETSSSVQSSLLPVVSFSDLVEMCLKNKKSVEERIKKSVSSYPEKYFGDQKLSKESELFLTTINKPTENQNHSNDSSNKVVRKPLIFSKNKTFNRENSFVWVDVPKQELSGKGKSGHSNV